MADTLRSNDSLAVLNDAENASAAIVGPLLAEDCPSGTIQPNDEDIHTIPMARVPLVWQ